MLKTRTLKISAAVVLACAVAVAFASKKNLTRSSSPNIISEKSLGSFHPYSASELKKKKLFLRDFQSQASENRNQALDARIFQGDFERLSSQEYLEDGTLLQADHLVTLAFKNGESVRIEKNGTIKIAAGKSIASKSTTECNPHLETLSSGIIQRELICSITQDSQSLDKLGVDYQTCHVEPFGPRSRKTTARLGSFRTKKGIMFEKATEEVVTVDGEVVCGTDRLGLGRETQITIYTNESPSVQEPSIGTRKTLFSLKKVAKGTGSVVYKSREEILESNGISPTKPVARKARPVKKLRTFAKH